MGYSEMIFIDEIDTLLDKAEEAIKLDEEASEDLKIAIETFIYEFEKHLKETASRVFVKDLRNDYQVNDQVKPN